jgi:tetratricopeptide (TPR) repeat protein
MGSRAKQRKTKSVTATRRSNIRNGHLTATIISILLAVVIWTAFGQTLHHEFVNYDDGSYVYENPKIVSGLSASNIAWALTHVHAANWHPLTTISHMLDCHLYGLQPWGHHLTNVVLHAAAVILLFIALWRLTGKLWASAFVAALFAIHPLRVESVAWVAERKDVLSGVFFALTLLAYAAYARAKVFSLVRYTIVLALFAVGLMCKPTLVTLPFVLLLLDYWPLDRLSGRWSAIRRVVAEKIPFFVLSAASCAATILAQKEALTPVRAVSFPERLANSVVSYVEYLVQTIYPADLAVLYPYPEGGLKAAEVILALLFLLTVSLILFRWRHIYPFALTGWLWFLGMLVPMIGIVQVGSQPRADRYTYLPQIGLYILVIWGAMELCREWRFKREALTVTGVLIIVALVTRSYAQTAYWRDSETLWTHAIEVTGGNYIAYNNLAGTLLDKGQFNEAITHYKRALEIKPNVAPVQSHLAKALLEQGQIDEAVAHLQKALEVDPNYAEAYNHLGTASLKRGQSAEAIAYYQKALQLNPSYADAHNNLGVAFLRTGQIDEAIAQYKEAAALNPGSAEMQVNLGNAVARKGNWEDAIACYQAALSTERDSAKAARLRNNLGAALEKAGKTDEAFEQFSQALQINGNYPEAHCNLGRLLVQRGQRDEAAAHFREALRLKPGYEEARKQLRNVGIVVAP